MLGLIPTHANAAGFGIMKKFLTMISTLLLMALLMVPTAGEAMKPPSMCALCVCTSVLKLLFT